MIDFNILIAKHAHNRSLTSLDGDPVGTSVGFRGAFEGDMLGFNVGYDIYE